MAEWYVPTTGEQEFFNELLNEVPQGQLTEGLVADLAGDLWASKVAAGKSIRVRVPGDTDWVEVHPKPSPARPAAVSPQSPPASEAPAKLTPLRHRGREVTPAMAQARREWQDKYGEGSKVMHGGPELDEAGRRFDAAGNPVGSAGPDERAQREIERLPHPGQVGYRGSRAMAHELDRIHQDSAQRAAVARQAAKPLPNQFEAQRAFEAELAARRASGDPRLQVYSHQQLVQVAAKHGYALPANGQR